MFGKIAGFEFRYQLRQPVFWVTTILILLIVFAVMGIGEIEIGSGGNVHKNSPFSIAELTTRMSIFYMFVTTAFVANVVVRDDETGFGPIVRATRMTKFDYLNGRFAGASLVAALGFLIVPLGIFLGSIMPWIDPEVVGPNRLESYAFAYFVLGLPTVLFTSALFFAVATVTRSMMWTYVAVIALLVVYTVASSLLGRKPEFETGLAFGDPFGAGAYYHATKYWTASERNALTPALGGPLTLNRLIVLGASFAVLALANALFRSASRGMKLGRQQKLRALADKAAPAAKPRGALPKPRFDAATARAQFLARTRLDMEQVFKSPAYLVLLALGVAIAFGTLWFSHEIYGTQIYPVTRLTVTTLADDFAIIPLIVAIYYAGELVWREHDRNTAGIVDATALPDWAFALPKVLAIALVLISPVIVGTFGGMIGQTLKGYNHYEIGKYLLWYVAPLSLNMVLLAVLAVFFQVISPHKFVGWGLMVIYLVAHVIMKQTGLDDFLYHYGGAPETPLSDMNGQGQFWVARAWFDLYWGAFAFLLVILSYGLWRRGTEGRFWPRLRRLPRVLRAWGGVAAALAALVFGGAGGFIYLNTHVWNTYRTPGDNDKWLADKEKQLLGYEHTPQPTPIAMTFDLDLHPHARRLLTRGAYVLENRTGAPLKTVHLNGDRDMKYLSVDLPGAHLEREYKEFNYRIYRFDRPLAPGARTTLSFTTLREQRGFKNNGETTALVDNGTFVYNFDFAPVIGIDRAGDRTGFLKDRTKRRKYGLPPELRLPRLEDDSARAKNDVADAPWVTSDITVTTDADQTPIAPGYKVRDETHGGRRTAEFTSEGPVLAFFSVQSGRYAEKHEIYKGIDIGVYYDRQHPYNVERMIKAAERGLDYYQANFSPYQFRQIRFIEFPDYGQFAEAFANTVPWSEGLGFIADLRHTDDGGDIDYVTFVAAHELAHQWWGHQEVAAEMQGESMLDETLAQYSALMVMEKIYGPDRIRKFLRYELDSYLRSRDGEVVEEVPLERVENQPYIHYRKGALVMYLLKDQLGEAAVNRALRKFLAQYAFKGPPYASSKDLVALFRAEAPADKQQLITDLFEKITLYDLKATGLVVKKRPDGRFDVRLTVSARKLYATGKGHEDETPIRERESFDVGLFTAKPGDGGFGRRNVVLFRPTPLKSGAQVLEFVTDKAPTFGGIDPYNKYIDRDSNDNVVRAGG